MLEDYSTPRQVTLIRRCARVPNRACLETVFLGHTVYFSILPGLAPWAIQIEPFQG